MSACELRTSLREASASADGAHAIPESAVDPRSGGTAVDSRMSKAPALVILSAAYFFNILILFDVVLKMMLEETYDRNVLMKMWDGFFIGQIVGQIGFGILCDSISQTVILHAAGIIMLVGSTLCTVARAIPINKTGFLWLIQISRGIIGVGIGGIYPAASMLALRSTSEGPGSSKNAKAFALATNGVFTAGGPLAAIVFLIVLSAAQPENLATVWPVCMGIGLVLPVVAVCCNSLWIITRRYRNSLLQLLSAYFEELKHCWFIMSCLCSLWFIYGFVAFPKIVFSGLILFTVVEEDLWRTAGFELLLGIFALCGSLIGAMLCSSFGWQSITLVSLVGYTVFALIIGCAYDQLVKIVPLFVLLYALMLSMGNLGLGNLLGFITAHSYPRRVRGAFYGITAAFGSAGAVSGIHAFNSIDENLHKRWGFIIAALCSLVGVVIAWSLPEEREEAPLDPSLLSRPEKARHETDIHEGASDNEVGLESGLSADDVDSVQSVVGDLQEQASTRGHLRLSSPPTPSLTNASTSPITPLYLASAACSPISRGTTSAAPAMMIASHSGSPIAYHSLENAPVKHVSAAGEAGPTSLNATPESRPIPRPEDIVHVASPRVPRTRPVDNATRRPAANRICAIYEASGLHTSAMSSATACANRPEHNQSTGPRLAIPLSTSQQTAGHASSRPDVQAPSAAMLLHRMSAVEYMEAVEVAPTPRQVQEAVSQYVASSDLAENFAENPAFLETIVERAANLPLDDHQPFSITEENVERIVRVSLYQPIIFCDDSGSMAGERWALQRDLVDRISKVVTQIVPDGYGAWLRFINSSKSGNNLCHVGILRMYNSVSPSNGTPLGTTLRERILVPLVYSVIRSRPNRKLERPLLICVITDGHPTDLPDSAFEDAIVECRRFLVREGSRPTQVRFCVNQVGNSRAAGTFLDRLRRNREIQDVVHCTAGILDTRFSELQSNEKSLNAWLLETLTDSIAS